jgi:hypothetical protein
MLYHAKTTVLLVIACLVVFGKGVSVVQNLARGSALKCLADLCGGLPFEIWKSNVILEEIRATHDGDVPKNDFQVLQNVLETRGVMGMWSGCSARMVEGFFSGAVLLASKETLRRSLTAAVGKRISPSIIGFVAGAGGGATQAVVMAPTSLFVTATTHNGGSVKAACQEIWSQHGIRGIYRGAPAVAARQATNWASRQGFTELLRPRIQVAGVPGEILAGCLGGTLSCWNTPFEVARIELQSSSFTDRKHGKEHHNMRATMRHIVKQRGVGGLYTGVVPRIFQSCYQTVFLVCIPRLLDAS